MNEWNNQWKTIIHQFEENFPTKNTLGMFFKVIMVRKWHPPPCWWAPTNPKLKKQYTLYLQLNPNNLRFVDGHRLCAQRNGHGHLGTQLISIYFSCSSVMFWTCGEKNDEKHEGGSGAGGCSLSMHLGEYSHGERRHESQRVQRGEERAG